MTWKEFLKDYLSFTRKERIAVLFLFGLIIVIFFIPNAVSRFNRPKSVSADTSWMNLLEKNMHAITQKGVGDSLESEEVLSHQFETSLTKEDKQLTREHFYFDPNTTLEKDWKRLGLKEKTIKTIKKYLEKGGRFNQPEDLGKIYGMKSAEYERLLPFVRIKPKSSELRQWKKETIEIRKINERSFSVDINTTDTSALIALPGIGSRLATRILNFRERLGGFYSLEQVAETYGLPDSTFQKIRPYLKLENPLVKKINLNTATVDELKSHPYIKWTLAQPIIAYRQEHGPFVNLHDLKKISSITEDLYQKLLPYLSLE